MSLRLISIDADGCVRIAADGPLTSDNLEADANPLAGLLGGSWGKHRILLDLAGADYIDSCAIGWLIETQRDLARTGGRLAVYNILPRVLRVLKILRIDTLVPLVDSELAARESASRDLPAAANARSHPTTHHKKHSPAHQTHSTPKREVA